MPITDQLKKHHPFYVTERIAFFRFGGNDLP
jgi:hypothetical protein